MNIFGNARLFCTSYDGGGPRDIPDEDEVCSCKSDDERDSREAGGVSLPLSKDKSSAADDSPVGETRALDFDSIGKGTHNMRNKTFRDKLTERTVGKYQAIRKLYKG